MSDFSIKQDWKNIDWKATFQYNVFRSICATPVWFFFIWLGPTGSGEIPWPMLLFPVFYFAFWMPLGLFSSWLARIGVPFAGLFTIICSLVIVIGDPVAWIISKIKPDLVPIEKPRFLNFNLIVFALKNDEAIPLCEHAGRIVANNNIQFLGYAFPLRQTLFIINSDWSVETLRDKNFGFLDIHGAIKRGRLQKGVDPRETNIGEMVGYIVEGNCYDIHQNHIGHYDTLPTAIPDETTTNSNELAYSEENHKQLLDELNRISETRKLTKNDFPSWYQTCSFAGHIEILNDLTFIGNEWSKSEMVFDIDLRGYIKTPYDDFYGYIEENGDIYSDNLKTENPVKVASLRGNFCYTENQKIGKFIPQTNNK